MKKDLLSDRHDSPCLTDIHGFWYTTFCFGRKSVARVRESIAENYQKRQ